MHFVPEKSPTIPVGFYSGKQNQTKKELVFIRIRLDKVRNVLVIFRFSVGNLSDKVGFFSEIVGDVSEF